MKKFIKIGKKINRNDSKPFTVAEVGLNHNGNLKLAKKMIEEASKAGCDAVKFQTFKADEFVNNRSQKFTYFSQGKKITEPMIDMFKRYELSVDSWSKIKKHCNKNKIIFLSTPQNYSDLKILLKVGMSAIKIGSDDLTNLPLIKKYSKTKLPIILSTGMSYESEINESLKELGTFKGYPTILLACTSLYPTKENEVNLLKIKRLKKKFPKAIVGFSDHTQGFLASSLAVTLGAKYLEKHFTLNKNYPGPDHWFSEDPEELANWVKSINNSYLMLGKSELKPTKREIKNKKLFQRYLVAAKNIPYGEKFKKDSFLLRRVSKNKGLSSRFIKFLVGKKSKRKYKKNQVIAL